MVQVSSSEETFFCFNEWYYAATPKNHTVNLIARVLHLRPKY